MFISSCSQASKCKQEGSAKNAEELLEHLNYFAEIFWASKGVRTERVTSPYPPSPEGWSFPFYLVIKLVRVVGNSMSPSLRHNDLIFIKERKKIFVNDIVIFNIYATGLIVKRVQIYFQKFHDCKG